MKTIMARQVECGCSIRLAMNVAAHTSSGLCTPQARLRHRTMASSCACVPMRTRPHQPSVYAQNPSVEEHTSPFGKDNKHHECQNARTQSWHQLTKQPPVAVSRSCTPVPLTATLPRCSQSLRNSFTSPLHWDKPSHSSWVFSSAARGAICSAKSTKKIRDWAHFHRSLIMCNVAWDADILLPPQTAALALQRLMHKVCC